MLTVSEAIRIYVQQRRAGAGAHDASHKDLMTFSERVGELALQRIAPHHIAALLHQISSSPVSWEAKYHALYRFFDFWVKRGEIQRAPMPSKRKDRSRAFVPYIYIRRSAYRGAIDNTKNNSSKAKLPLHPTLATLLLAWKIKWSERGRANAKARGLTEAETASQEE